MRRDVLIMCVSAGMNVGEIAWRRCQGISIRMSFTEVIIKKKMYFELSY